MIQVCVLRCRIRLLGRGQEHHGRPCQGGGGERQNALALIARTPLLATVVVDMLAGFIQELGAMAVFLECKLAICPQTRARGQLLLSVAYANPAGDTEGGHASLRMRRGAGRPRMMNFGTAVGTVEIITSFSTTLREELRLSMTG